MVSASSRSDIAVGQGVFVLSSEEVSRLKLDDHEMSCIKPYINPSSVDRYSINDSENFIIYSDSLVRKKIQYATYPKLKRHLDSLSEFITSSNGPYGLHRPRDEIYFKSPKLLFKIMFKAPCFSLDEEGRFYLGFSFISIIKKKKPYSLRYLLALLNSTFAHYWFFKNGKMRGIGFDIGATKLREFPVPKAGTNRHMEVLVGYLLNLAKTKSKLQSAYFEQLIDGLVYELYFPEEIQSAGKELLPHLGELTPIDESMSEAEKLAIIQREFDRLYDPRHPVRNHLETLDSVPVVRIIREALKR